MIGNVHLLACQSEQGLQTSTIEPREGTCPLAESDCCCTLYSVHQILWTLGC